MQLTDTQIERYSRQIIVRGVGGRGQMHLLESRITLVGYDPVMLVAAQYLVAAGIGGLDWVATDTDTHGVVAATETLHALNADTDIVPRDPGWMDARDVPTTIAACAGSPDTQPALTGLNRFALRARAPLLVAGVEADEVCVAVYAGHLASEACAECAPPAQYEPARSIDPTRAGLIGSVLAFEAIAACVGFAGAVRARMLRFDGKMSAVIEQPISKRASCRACLA